MAEKKESKAKTVKPSWIKIKPEEMEKIVLDLAKEGKTPAQIGLILRDQHGIPKAKLLGKTVKQILDEAEVEYTGDKEVLTKKIDTLKNHFGKNKHDYSAQRALTKKLWAMYHLEKKAK